MSPPRARRTFDLTAPALASRIRHFLSRATSLTRKAMYGVHVYELLRIASGSLKQRHRLVCTHDGGLVPRNLTTKELGKSMIGNDSQENECVRRSWKAERVRMQGRRDAKRLAESRREVMQRCGYVGLGTGINCA